MIMKRKKVREIAKAQGLYNFPTSKNMALKYESGFIDGAEWRINSVWHDVDKELPEYNRHVVNEDWFDFTAKDEKDLKRIMNQYPFKRWAYVDDLKPNMEE